jgi:hypothetical protein
MKTYKVTISGQQKHIAKINFEGRTAEQVEAIIDRYYDEEESPRPQMDGNSYELNCSQYIRIEEERDFYVTVDGAYVGHREQLYNLPDNGIIYNESDATAVAERMAKQYNNCDVLLVEATKN